MLMLGVPSTSCPLLPAQIWGWVRAKSCSYRLSPREAAAAAPIPPVLASVGIWDFGNRAELLSNSARLCLAEGRAANAVRQRSP